MNLRFQSLKASAGSLDPLVVGTFAKTFGLDTFIETGTYRGDTTAALSDVFQRLISVELSLKYHLRARWRFRANPKVKLVRGDSAAALAKTFAHRGKRGAFIWLDAHYSGAETAKGEENTPIMQEVDVIHRLGSEDDIIVVDDLRMFWTAQLGFLVHEAVGGYPSATALINRLNGAGRRYDCFVMQDALVAIPHKYQSLYTPSPVLLACSESRLGAPSVARAQELERIISAAEGVERTAITTISEMLDQQSHYGLGGHYYYWRGLIREKDGDTVGAESDFAFARKSGVSVPDRVPA